MVNHHSDVLLLNPWEGRAYSLATSFDYKIPKGTGILALSAEKISAFIEVFGQTFRGGKNVGDS